MYVYGFVFITAHMVCLMRNLSIDNSQDKVFQGSYQESSLGNYRQFCHLEEEGFVTLSLLAAYAL